MHHHYYSTEPKVESHPFYIEATIRGNLMRFKSDAGVFSKDKIDRGSLLLVNSLPVKPDELILDLGCGYGVIGLGLARAAPQGRALLVDVNERALSLAAENAKLNRLTNVEVRASDGFAAISPTELFSLIVTNPPIRAGKEVYYPFVDGAYAHLIPGGMFAAVLQTKHGAKSFAEKIRETFGNVETLEIKGGYRVLAGRR
ncbi:MAG: class I SAM-dependent methyltransferase [Firmicutes bacterium]|nr:class I SAM-dependent methyltransferase [Bacillota bacterium]